MLYFSIFTYICLIFPIGVLCVYIYILIDTYIRMYAFPIFSTSTCCTCSTSRGESQGQNRCCRLPPCCPELRARWRRRAERCCWPCLQVAGAACLLGGEVRVPYLVVFIPLNTCLVGLQPLKSGTYYAGLLTMCWLLLAGMIFQVLWIQSDLLMKYLW